MRKITERELETSTFVDKYMEDREQYVERIINEGYKILVPDSNELFIDIDSEEDFDQFNVAIKRIRKEWGTCRAEITESKSGLPRRHIVVKMPFEICPLERIAYQAVMGSDLTREMLSLFRYRRHDPVPTLFAEKGEAK